MTVVYELPREEVTLHARSPFESAKDAELALVKRGTDTTRALFAATEMVFALHHSGHDPAIGGGFLATMMLLSYKHVVLAGETEAVDDIQGVGTYHWYKNLPDEKTARIVDLYMRERDRNKGIGAQIVNRIEHDVADDGAEFIELTSAFAAIPFYVRNGYVAQSQTVNGLYKRLD